ncbi:MAG: V-type ATP synthase subunit E family protein [Bacteroides sp.]|nr:V-type ATP synthase subunit E family protein [Bacillota bacterium]MCM1394396.1 V-type ATP synthase subunit E family protein [[Eubacterium] siraeum]MCM1455554.1 V-type ATP synthase subunit E family protein [Bacteroides sp.]
MSKESIVQKIISDAKTRANSFVQEQKAKADDILAEAAQYCKSYIFRYKAETDKMVADIEARSKTVAELDAKKIMLAAKTKLLDGVYSRATEKLAALNGDTLRRLLLSMLGAVAEDGDAVTLGKGQKDLISASDVAGVGAVKGISLTLSDEYGDFDGMILRGKGVDKNLTFDVEIALLREETEMQIAKELFG